MSKLPLEAAALIGVIAATISGVSYALGTVARSAYFRALGLDARQFLPVGLELHVGGMVYALPLAVYIGSIVLVYASVLRLANRPGAPEGRLPLLLSAAMITTGAIILFSINFFIKSPLILDIGVVLLSITVITAINIGWSILGPWVLSVAVGCLMGVATLPLAIKYVNDRAEEDGKAQVAKAGKSVASTIIELADGNKITIPGVRVACSERFCGFHDGKRATVISLEGVRSIQWPQEPLSHTK